MRSVLLFMLCCCAAAVSAQHKIVFLPCFDACEQSSKTLEEAQSAYAVIAGAPITLSTPRQIANNCENRAEFGYKVLAKLGFKPITFWIFKEGLIEHNDDLYGLEYQSDKLSRPVSWRYHVASGIIIPHNHTVDTLVFDPWTQGHLTTFSAWAGSFYGKPKYKRDGSVFYRTVYTFAVSGSHTYFPLSNKGYLAYTKEAWDKYLDLDEQQLYCGLAGIRANGQCGKKRFQRTITEKKAEITRYLADKDIMSLF